MTQLAPVANTIVISQYQVLLDDIAEAQAAAVPSFDYATKAGSSAARSYIFKLRKLRGRIETARKEAKSYALEYGKRVDSQAKELSSQVDALIAPHQSSLDEIAAREAARVAAHQLRLDRATALGVVSFGATSAAIAAQLRDLDTQTLDDLEEFEPLVAAALVRSRAALQEALSAAMRSEAEAAELARLRAEAEAAAQREREEQIRREAQAKADADAQAAIADALAAAEQRVAEAEHRATLAALSRAAAPPTPTPKSDAAAAQPAVPLDEPHIASALMELMRNRPLVSIAKALASNTFHPGVHLDPCAF